MAGEMGRKRLSRAEHLRVGFGLPPPPDHLSTYSPWKFVLEGEEWKFPLAYRMSYALSKRKGLSSNARRRALDFVNAIEIYRARWRDLRTRYKKVEEMPKPSFTWHPTPLWTFQDGSEFEPATAWRNEAADLPEFSEGSWKQWANLAWRVVVAVSPEGRPEMNSELCSGPSRICNVRKTRSDDNFNSKPGSPAKILRSSPSIARDDLKEAFFNAFQEVAAVKSRRRR